MPFAAIIAICYFNIAQPYCTEAKSSHNATMAFASYAY